MYVNKITRPIHSIKHPGHGKVGKDTTFAKVLHGTMDKVQCEETSKEALSSISEVAPAACCGISRVGGWTLQCASKVLSLMEEYAQDLNNPRKSLKAIEPIVVQIQEELRGLDVQSAQNPGHHDELARLVNQIAITASIETFKFQRGDYIA